MVYISGATDVLVPVEVWKSTPPEGFASWRLHKQAGGPPVPLSAQRRPMPDSPSCCAQYFGTQRTLDGKGFSPLIMATIPNAMKSSEGAWGFHKETFPPASASCGGLCVQTSSKPTGSGK